MSLHLFNRISQFCKYHIEGERAKSGEFSQDGIHTDMNGFELFLAGGDEEDEDYYYITIVVEKLP